MFKHDMVSFLGSDVHQPRRFYPYVRDAVDKIIEIIGERKFKELSEVNIEAVINDEEIEFADYTHIEKNIFGKYR